MGFYFDITSFNENPVLGPRCPLRNPIHLYRVDTVSIVTASSEGVSLASTWLSKHKGGGTVRPVVEGTLSETGPRQHTLWTESLHISVTFPEQIYTKTLLFLLVQLKDYLYKDIFSFLLTTFSLYRSHSLSSPLLFSLSTFLSGYLAPGTFSFSRSLGSSFRETGTYPLSEKGLCSSPPTS